MTHIQCATPDAQWYVFDDALDISGWFVSQRLDPLNRAMLRFSRWTLVIRHFALPGAAPVPSPASSAWTVRSVSRWTRGGGVADEDRLAVEEPLEIRIGDEPLAVTMRTPTGADQDCELAAGFCLTEGVVADGDDLERVEICGEARFGNVVAVTLTDQAMQQRACQVAQARRELYLSSSCGLCGKQSLDRIEQRCQPVQDDFKISAALLAQLPDVLREAQPTFAQTGGLHAAGLFKPDGNLIAAREDVGRHNAVDKLIGRQLLLGSLPLDPAVLLVSGRTSFEIMQKAAMAGAAIVAGVSAPSSLALDFAKRMNMTLAGFLRAGRMNVYHDPGRLV